MRILHHNRDLSNPILKNVKNPGLEGLRLWAAALLNPHYLQ